MYIIKAIFSTSRFIISEIKLIKILEVVLEVVMFLHFMDIV